MNTTDNAIAAELTHFVWAWAETWGDYTSPKIIWWQLDDIRFRRKLSEGIGQYQGKKPR